jgi:DeoR family transcriptional regulator, suf operon transcriptional repressor
MTGAHDNWNVGQRGPGQDILRLLQRHGPLDIARLQAELGVTRNAVREQLASLAAAGLVHSRSQRRGVGRPALVYALTHQAQASMARGYDVLLKLLLAEVAERAGANGLNTILSGVSARLARQYSDGEHGGDLQRQLQTLAAAYESYATPITLVEDGDELVLHEHSCPYFNVAQENGAVCGVEQRMLEQVLGRKVELTQRIVDGYASCRFVIGAANRSGEVTDDTPTTAGHNSVTID